MQYAGLMFLWGSMFCDEDLSGVGNHVGIGEETVFAYDESSADTSAESTGFPWLEVIWNLCCNFKFDDRTVDSLVLKSSELGNRWLGRGWLQSLGHAIAGQGCNEAEEN